MLDANAFVHFAAANSYLVNADFKFAGEAYYREISSFGDPDFPS